MKEIDKNEDWLKKLNEQIAIQNKMLQEYAEGQARMSESLSELKAILVKQINDLRKLNGLDSSDL